MKENKGQTQNWTNGQRLTVTNKRRATIAAMSPDEKSEWNRAWNEKRLKSNLATASLLMRDGKCLCNKCGKYKNEGEFYPSVRMGLNRRSTCKSCTRIKQNAWNALHPEVGAARSAARRAKNPAHVRWAILCCTARDKGFAVMSLANFIAWFDSQVKACVYCGMGQEASMAMFKRSLCIDRMDNTRGYEVGNVTLACHRCNTVKSSHLTYDQMMTVAAMFFRPRG